jgi:hypothetical protein
MKSKPNPSCRLQILLARRAPIGVIFRRGPTKWVQVIKWDTKKDVFEEGQWFHGRIYAGRSDLSPNGTFMIYFASKFNPKTLKDKEYTYAWTAVSRPPYLTALALWPKGDCWQGGGLFTTHHDVFLNHRPEDAKPHHRHLPTGLRVTTNPKAAGEDEGVLIPRQERDRWKLLQGLDHDYYGRRTIQPAVMEKKGPHGKVKLRVEKYFDPEEQWACSLVTAQGKVFSIGIGTWADFDQAGRLAFASEGKLFEAKLRDGTVDLAQLADFNNSKPESVKPPTWATRW